MSLSGQYNYRGINAQAWAAMSLFLQFLRDPKFLSIHLEGAKCEDFNLIFNDGRKIICESKARKQKFSYPQLKALLLNINYNKDIGQDDEILIICSNLNNELLSNIENLKYFPVLKEKFEKNGFPEEIIGLLPKVKFWIVAPEFNEKIIYSLFTQLINFWVPLEDIKRIVDSILVQKIYKKSAKGQQYSRQMISIEIENFKKEVSKRGSYLKETKKLEKNFLFIEKTVKANKGVDWGTGDVSAISQWELATFALNLLKTRNSLDLQQWNDLWQLTSVSYCAFSIFDIFEKNLKTEKNIQYVLSYISLHLADIRTFYRDSYLDSRVLKTISLIIESEKGVSYLLKAFDIIRDILTYNSGDFFYLEEKVHDPTLIWKKGEICKLLVRLYQLADGELRQQIFDLTVKNFNFTEDDGEFDFYAPQEVFQIFKLWIEDDFISKFPVFIQKIRDQYDVLYGKYTKKKKNFYDGWDHIGGGISFGGSYYVSDRHFIGCVLAPAIKQFYNTDSIKGWEFIIKNCVFTEKEINRDKPDFLNRSVFEIVLDRYASDDHTVSNEAFEILKEWILSKKGIPHKADLVYQAIVNSPIPDTKKWKLIDITASKFEAPVNPFVTEIVTNLAKKGFKDAEVQLQIWAKNPKYYNRFMFEIDPIRSIKNLLDTNFDLSMNLFKEFLKSDQIKSETGDRFGAFDVAVLLHDILKKDYVKGSSILRELEKEKNLSKNQQVVYTYSLFNYHGSDESDDSEMLMKVYKDFVDPFLTNLENNNNLLCNRITSAGSRQAIAQFAVRLAQKKHFKETLRIISVLVDDPDPYMPNLDPDDPENKFNRHLQMQEGKSVPTIETVRGWCCWALMKCAVLEGRSQILQVIKLVERLSKDKNYYIVHMVCFALGQLARIRLTVLPQNINILFLNDDVVKALTLAKHIEKITFTLFERILSFDTKVKQALEVSILNVLTHIRALNQKNALKLVNYLKKFSEEGKGEAAGLFIYYAEFRKNSFKDWKFNKPNLYDDLAPDNFDERPFRKITVDLMENGPDNLKQRFASQLEFLIREGDEYLDIVIRYFHLLSKKYHHSTFSLIYHVISYKMPKKTNFNKWYKLYLFCLKTEKAYYDKNLNDINKIQGIYWWPSLYNDRTLLDIEIQGGKEKFLESADILFSFPKELCINETDPLIEKLLEYKNDKRVKTIVDNLFKRNPSKYFYLKKRLK